MFSANQCWVIIPEPQSSPQIWYAIQILSKCCTSKYNMHTYWCYVERDYQYWLLHLVIFYFICMTPKLIRKITELWKLIITMAVTAENFVTIFCKIPLFSKELVQVQLNIFSTSESSFLLRLHGIFWNEQCICVCIHTSVCYTGFCMSLAYCLWQAAETWIKTVGKRQCTSCW